MRLLFLSLFCILSLGTASQKTVLYDKLNNRPVSDALIFIDKTNYNSVSRSDGSVDLDPTIANDEVLYLSHINYEFEEMAYAKAVNSDTLFLTPTQHQLTNVEVLAKSSRKRKRWLKQFEQDFLGVNAQKYKVRILNPEVILFEEEGTRLKASSSRPVVIHNEFLRYKTRYWLQDYESEKDGTVRYHGKYFIEDLDTAPRQKVMDRRTTVYHNSLEHLLKAIAAGNYEDHFILKLGRILQDGTIELLRKYDVTDHLTEGSNGIYEIRFGGILQVEHLSIKALGNRKNLRSLSGMGQQAEQDMIQHDRNTTYNVGKYERSYLFTRTSRVLFDKTGRVLNSQDIKVYGYWGNLGMADVLPLPSATTKNKPVEEKKKISQTDELAVFLDLLSGSPEQVAASFAFLEESWDNRFLAPCLDLLLLHRDPSTRRKLITLLTGKTGHKGGADYYNWLTYLWEQQTPTAEFYDELKAVLYGTLDPAFSTYFAGRDKQTTIRMEEVVWGGVRQDGIPPLRKPRMIFADQADYLADQDLVFGLAIENEYRAYPKRILGWHEMVTDEVGGRSIAGVYCTLCGTMIAYDMHHDGQFHDLGTSGFLYRSNKLMYDKATQSLWNTIEGKPVIGPLADEQIALTTYPVVTTTWKAWKTAHPSTLVLSLETGHQRNYGEGEAYKDYYATDRLMFPVPGKDQRLKNKDEVLVVRAEGYRDDPVALSVNYLIKNPIVQLEIDGNRYVVFTDSSGASRVYERGQANFEKVDRDIASDENGGQWRLSEDAIIGDRTSLVRVPAHRIFWFAWYNAFPETRLIK